MKIGVIGCGGIGLKHCMALKALASKMDIEVTALADTRATSLQQAAVYWPNAQRYHQGSHLIANAGVNMVYICLPSFLHTGHALMAMQKGMHVFLEKPACLTLQDCEKLLQKQQQMHSKVAVGQVLRFFKEYMFLKNIYSSGELGPLQALIMGRFCGRAEPWFYNEQTSGTVVLDLHIHDIDFMRWLLGQPRQLTVTAATGCNNIVNHVSSVYSYPGMFVAAQAMWDVSTATPFEASYRAQFAKGTVVYNSRHTQPIKLYAGNKVTCPNLPSQAAQIGGINVAAIEPYYLESEYFIQNVISGGSFAKASLANGVASVQMALQELAMAKEWLAKHTQ